MAKARENVQSQLAQLHASGDDRDFGELEVQAMEQVEALRLVGGLDLYSILLRHKFLVNIRDHALLGVHPGRYHSLKEMADGQGISVSELHDILSLGDTIFPFITREYGENAVADLWDELGKARMRELTATLVSAITGQRSQSANVRTAIATAEGAAALQHRTESILEWDRVEPTERNRRTAREIVEIARRSPNVREMRQALRGNTGTENITLFVHQEDENHFTLIGEVTNDQKLMITRLMTDRVEFQPVNDNDGNWGGAQNVFLGVGAMMERARVRLNAPTDEA